MQVNTKFQIICTSKCISYKWSTYRKKEVLHSLPHLLQLCFSNLTVSQLHLLKKKDIMLSVTLYRALLMISLIYFSIVVDSQEVCNECDIIYLYQITDIKTYFFSKCYLYSLKMTVFIISFLC